MRGFVPPRAIGSNPAAPSSGGARPALAPRVTVPVPLRPAATTVAAAATAPARPVTGAAVECHSVLYTKKGPKKRKTFADGVMTVTDGKMTLFDMDGKQVTQKRMRPNEFSKLGEGSEFELASFQVEVGARVSAEAYLSGRVFSASAGAASAQLADAVSKKENMATAFKSPATSTTTLALSSAMADPTQRLPAHDPLAPNALVLCRGVEAHGTVDIVVDPGLTQHLRPHQREGVRFLFECVSGMRRGQFPGRGCILADAMGLGKTLQTITLIWTLLKQGARGRGGLPLARKAVVVCPASLVDNWAREVAKWLGPAKLTPITVNEAGEAATRKVGTFQASKVHPLLIISYETYRKHADALNKTDGLELLVCDEGHRLKAAGGNKTIDALNKAPTARRLILTGTPLQNNLEELYAVVSFVNPQALGRDPAHFKKVFAGPIERGRDKGSNAQDKRVADERARELSRLTSSFILRRTEEVNRAFLPPKRETNVFCRPSDQQLAMYQDFLDEHAPAIDRLGSSAGGGTDALKLIMQLRQLCTHPLLLKDQHAAPPLGGLGWIASSGKLAVLDAMLREMKQDDCRVVLVSCFTTTLDLLQKLCELRGYATLRLDGATPIEQRQPLVNRFNAAGGPFCFLLSSKAGGCGINLVGANRLVLVDGDWNPATDAQALARVWRDGQTKPVIVYRLLATGTIEERILQRQIMKTETSQGVLAGGGESSCAPSSSSWGEPDVKFTRGDLKRLFVLRDDTACDTFDLLGESQHDDWKPYGGVDDIQGDDALKRAAAKSPVTWVSSSMSILAQPEPREERVGELLDQGDDEPPAPQSNAGSSSDDDEL